MSEIVPINLEAARDILAEVLGVRLGGGGDDPELLLKSPHQESVDDEIVAGAFGGIELISETFAIFNLT